LNVPIYSGGMVSSREREAAKQVERAAEELRAQERSVERNVLGNYDRIRGANARIEALLQSQRLIEQGLAVKRTAYANGLVTGLAVIDAERDLNTVRSELARARYDFMLGLLSLKRAAGLLEESDLQALDALLERDVTVEALGL
jgi:outer membrane protein